MKGDQSASNQWSDLPVIHPPSPVAAKAVEGLRLKVAGWIHKTFNIQLLKIRNFQDRSGPFSAQDREESELEPVFGKE